MRILDLRPWPRARADDADRPRADIVLRLAVLLRAGLAPRDAWRYLADSGDPDAAAVIGDGGADLGAAIAARGPSWRPLGAAWSVATVVGAPLSDTLRALADALREADDGRDEVRVALAEPASTSRLLVWLPLVGVLLGIALGFDTVGVLVTTPLGAGCTAVGVTLVLLARRWTRTLVSRAQPPEGVPGLVPELLAIALSGGVSLGTARELVADAVPDEPDDETERLLALSGAAGVPAVELLRASAAMARHRARVAGRMRVATLSTRLLLPLGVCVLPAFLALGVAPMLLSVLDSTSLSL